jgi:hypothetical protein
MRRLVVHHGLGSGVAKHSQASQDEPAGITRDILRDAANQLVNGEMQVQS